MRRNLYLDKLLLFVGHHDPRPLQKRKNPRRVHTHQRSASPDGTCAIYRLVQHSKHKHALDTQLGGHKINTANPTWGDIFECCFKARSSKLERLFLMKRGKRDVRALSFELERDNVVYWKTNGRTNNDLQLKCHCKWDWLYID